MKNNTVFWDKYETKHLKTLKKVKKKKRFEILHVSYMKRMRVQLGFCRNLRNIAQIDYFF